MALTTINGVIEVMVPVRGRCPRPNITAEMIIANQIPIIVGFPSTVFFI
jgi:hypothetical protein